MVSKKLWVGVNILHLVIEGPIRYHCRYHFLTNLQNMANPIELKLPFFNNKSSKNNCYGEV